MIALHFRVVFAIGLNMWDENCLYGLVGQMAALVGLPLSGLVEDVRDFFEECRDQFPFGTFVR